MTLVPPLKPGQLADFEAFDAQESAAAKRRARADAADSMLKMAILGGLQLATTAFSEGDTSLRAALHTPEEPPSQRARSQRLWCPL